MPGFATCQWIAEPQRVLAPTAFPFFAADVAEFSQHCSGI